jgi:hypothetical protein
MTITKIHPLGFTLATKARKRPTGTFDGLAGLGEEPSTPPMMDEPSELAKLMSEVSFPISDLTNDSAFADDSLQFPDESSSFRSASSGLHYTEDSSSSSSHQSKSAKKEKFAASRKLFPEDTWIEKVVKPDLKAMEKAMEKFKIPQVYEPKELELLAKCRAAYAKDEAMNHKKLKLSTPLVQGGVSTGGSSADNVTIRVTNIVHAPVEFVLARLMNHDVNYRAVVNRENSMILRECILDRKNDHHAIQLLRIKSPVSIIKNRESVMSILWEKDGEGEYFVASNSIEHDDYPVTPSFVRIEVMGIYKIKQIGDSATHMQLVGSVNMKGNIPKYLNDKVTIPQLCNRPLKFIHFFAVVRPPEEYDDSSSRELGHIIFHLLHPLRSKVDALRQAISIMMTRYAVFRYIKSKYPWFDELLFHVITNKVRSATSVPSPRLASFGREDAANAGKGLAHILIGRSGEAAILEWVRVFPALGELDPFFRPVMEVLAVELLAKISFAVKLLSFR